MTKKPVDVRGEVLAADLRQMECQLRLDDDTLTTVPFRPEHANDVMSALRNHSARRLQVIGEGEFSDGKLLRIAEVRRLYLLPVAEKKRGAAHRPIEEIAAELGKEIPQEEWDSLPDDLIENMDHYLYGWPKK